jgi:phosphoenolpyruvate carboxylase
MLSNMDMVLAKSDTAIASRYAELVSDSALREAIFGRLRAEWGESVRALLAITEQKTLLEQNRSKEAVTATESIFFSRGFVDHPVLRRLRLRSSRLRHVSRLRLRSSRFRHASGVLDRIGG